MTDSAEGIARANQLLMSGDRLGAAEVFRQELAAHPEDPNAHHGLGVLAMERAAFDEAREHVAAALGVRPDEPAYLCTLGEIERLRGDYAAAEDALRRALAADPSLAQAHNNLGLLLLTEGRYVEAATTFMTAVQLEPTMAMGHFNLAIAFRELNLADESIESCRRAIALQPNFAEAHVNLALALLVDGQLEEGFEEYEWRLRTPLSSPPATAAPMWDGTLQPKWTLLVWAEQGLGDVIQFIRYVPLIARQGMRVVVQCPAAVESLIQCVEGVASTCRLDEPLPAHDVWIPLLSLPRLFETRLDRIPRDIPYLLPPFAKVKAWRERLAALGDEIKVGLRWAGNPENTNDVRRSLPLAAFLGLAGIPGIRLISIDNRAPAAQDVEAAARLRVADFAADLTDFTETAALVANLDMVITVDTSVLHLAGALGKPVWGLIKLAPDWRWMLERSDSPWYPTLRLFRQGRDGDWAEAVAGVVAMLAEAMRLHSREG